MEQPRKPQEELHRIITCARLNRTTGPLSPHRFEACAHHQTGSCTPFQKERIVSIEITNRSQPYT
eukprot:scaffold2192_cov268-Chaetoceros_neogracile.AAC.84